MTIDTEKIPAFQGRFIGRAFYYAYMRFIEDPENEKMIKERAKELREKEEESCSEEKRSIP